MRWQAFGILLLLCIAAPGAVAADITVSAGQQDYYFLTGQPVEIPLTVTSSFPDDVQGTVRFSTDTQLQKTGTVMISTQNRVFSRTVPAGRSFLNLTMAASQVSQNYKVHISFYYATPSPVNASLPEFFVHIVTDPGLVKNSPVLLESTSLPESGQIPSASSVGIVEQTVGIREQMGSDSTGGISPASGQPQPDPEKALQQPRDRETREREQEEFDSRLGNDPLMLAVNASLVSEGFRQQAVDTQPAGNDTGTFSMMYHRGAEDRVVVRGSMRGGVVFSVNEVANAAISADPALDVNTTFRSIVGTLAEQDFDHRETQVNRTLTGAIVNSTFVSDEGRKAFVNATTDNNRVVQVTMGYEGETSGFSRGGVTVLVMVILMICMGFAYRKYRSHRSPVPEPVAGSLLPDFDHRMEAERFLNEAELSFARQQYRDAYGLASRALRIFLSSEYGDHGEVTPTEIVSHLLNAGMDARDIGIILRQCDDVVFARGEPDTGEFSSVVYQIRKMIAAP